MYCFFFNVELGLEIKFVPFSDASGLHTSPISLFFPARSWAGGVRPQGYIPTLNLSSSCSTDIQLSSLRPKALRPSHRPANCPACGRYFTFGHNMKAHLKRCPKNPQKSNSGAPGSQDDNSPPPSPSNLHESYVEAYERV